MNVFGFSFNYDLFDFILFSLQFFLFELLNFVHSVKGIIKEEKCKINKEMNCSITKKKKGT